MSTSRTDILRTCKHTFIFQLRTVFPFDINLCGTWFILVWSAPVNNHHLNMNDGKKYDIGNKSQVILKEIVLD